jgi:hypothetical protein
MSEPQFHRDRHEQAEIRREQEAGELHDLTDEDPFPPTRYDS